MPENVNITPGIGDIVGADDISGVKYQRVKLIFGDDGVNAGDVSATNRYPVAVTSLPLPAGASTEAKQDSIITALGPLATAGKQDSMIAALGLLATETTSASILAGIGTLNAKDFATETTLQTVAKETTLAARLSESAFVTRVGEVVDTPANYTLLKRVKDIVTQMVTQVRGLFDSAGNAIASYLFDGRRVAVESSSWQMRMLYEGRSYGVLAEGIVLTLDGVYQPVMHVYNPPASGKNVFIDKAIMTSDFGGDFCMFECWINPTVTANGTTITPGNRKAGGAVATTQTFYTPTVTPSTGVPIDEVSVAKERNSEQITSEAWVMLPPGTRFVIFGAPKGNAKSVSVSLHFTEVPI